jgi:hypothetical protein
MTALLLCQAIRMTFITENLLAIDFTEHAVYNEVVQENGECNE